MATYSVENGFSELSGEGMTREAAMLAAKREAERTGKTRYVVSSDPNEAAEPVVPDYPGIETMTKNERHELAEKIALEHGCEFQPTAFQGTALAILRKYQQGGPLDEKRLADCAAALESAGVKPAGLVS